MLKLFWLDFDEQHRRNLPMGVGITAQDEKDAVDLARTRLFDAQEFPTSFRIKIIPDLDALEQNHVRPNIGHYLRRGIWFPIGYDSSWSP
ncbi:MAG: hypothetical protein E5W01_09310 [Mesorhizobium sp.]|uniref:hypothetical protein n=1 Tax=Mesorhizobium sp. TaxID=1871066 RepID=UPI000FE943A1|nr:hypothetical protein [Mesorhizobium sp.]RWE66754.1 MAG: hypothetical protein EOS62_19030 [Mesorhizobium sp.]TIS75853.1 MAG: hypothetical protein E5W94_19875 [Mesorhizobium sp.]TIU90835.1 MAG: hypothetical protein E5W01_09310 [Mesorhizobium sp.]TIX03386.1 MAG: hypothetical protein E5V57_19060 [Mesorhizobium sp.]